MNTAQIDSVLSKHPVTRLFSIRTSASDQLPDEALEYPFIGVVNLDPISQPGSHWTAFVVLDRNSSEYFDSYGLPPTEPINRFLRKHSKKILWNTRVIQAPGSLVCGAHCLFFLIHRCIGYSMSEITNQLYSDNLKKNDCKAAMFVKPYVSRCLNVTQTCNSK